MRLTWLLEVHTSVRFCFQFQSPDQKHVLVERLSLSMYWFFPPTQKDSCQTIIMNKLLAEQRRSQINHKDMSSARSDERTFTSRRASECDERAPGNAPSAGSPCCGTVRGPRRRQPLGEDHLQGPGSADPRAREADSSPGPCQDERPRLESHQYCRP